MRAAVCKPLPAFSMRRLAPRKQQPTFYPICGEAIMHESAVTLSPAAYQRVQGAIDTASGAVAGFALLAGARAFTFVALFAWREPVLGGAGLMLLALVGWLRW